MEHVITNAQTGETIIVPFTPEEEAARIAQQNAQADVPLGLVQIASARLTVDGWDVTGLERSQGIAGAFLLDTDHLYVQLTDEQEDATYIVIPDDGVEKFPDHVEVMRPGLSNVSFIIQRVQ